MDEFVKDLLDECEKALAAAETSYRRDIASRILSDELLFLIRALARHCQSALDATAARVGEAYPGGSISLPRFPLAASAGDFDNKIEEQLTGLLRSQPMIAAAFERHQPYQPGNAELGYLHTLGHADKRTDFSKQKRTEVVEIERVPGGGFIVSVVGSTDRSRDREATAMSERTGLGFASPDIVRHMTRSVFAGWTFVDPPGPVLQTLRALLGETRDAVTDICQEAGLPHMTSAMAAHGSVLT
jgi:hypothetical protein